MRIIGKGSQLKFESSPMGTALENDNRYFRVLAEIISIAN